jgi:UDP-glucose 4-epimerase
MNILVTGGAGYIGSHTCKALLQEGFNLIILDNFSSGREELIAGGKVIRKDLQNLNAIHSVIKNHDISAVLHFASLIQVGESYRNPHKYYTANLLNSLNLLDAMLAAGIDTFIFSSSAAVYGVPSRIPIDEQHPCRPINPYGQTKLFIEKILQDYTRAYGLNYVSLRYFNAAGADPQGELGEMHDPETHLIPNILLSLLKGNNRLEVFGTDFPTEDGTAIRDYIHVSDLADAHVLALKYLTKNKNSQVINLGSNHGFSVLEIIRAAEKVTGRNIKYEIKPKRQGDVPVLLASNTKAKKILNWNPQLSDITTIIQTAWRWHRRSAKIV